jgi:two-component system, NtrC family, response regulator GlrR
VTTPITPVITVGLDRPGVDHFRVKQYRLRVIAGPDQGKVHTTTRERLTIGTHKSADFVLTDPTMSRFHCELSIADKGVEITDLGSRNLTIVDNVTVKIATLRDGATLRLGTTHLRFELGDSEAKVAMSTAEQFGLLVGKSPAMRALFAVLEQAAATRSTVLISGETGAGKELVAESLHLQSDRRDGPFVVVDLGAAPSTLLDSELFGHERGAFTGADRERAGAFEAAEGGTLFLDEIGELAIDLQPKLLRVLETRRVQRIGSQELKPVDIRVIAATNRNLRAEVNARRFRSDLFYRLAVIDVVVPPLRDRLDDLPVLVDALLETSGATTHPRAAALREPAFISELTHHAWPGNVRELRNYLERCLTMDEPPPVDLGSSEPPLSTTDLSQPLNVLRERLERRYLEGILRLHPNNIRDAAKSAGIARSQFYRMIARYGLR